MKLRRRCEHCSKIFEVGKDIRWIECPYDYDVCGDDTKMWHCDDCDIDCSLEI
jgi:hypothetical protein